MTAAAKLTGEDRDAALSELRASGWQPLEDRDGIRKVFTFKNFIEAFGWMTRAAIWAEKWNHHPEWSNVYKTVEVTLITHECDGLSERDVKLARKMDSLA